MIVDHAELKSNESQHITGSNGYYLAMQAMAIEVKGLLFISKGDLKTLAKAFNGISIKDQFKLNAQVLIPVSDSWYRFQPVKVYDLDHTKSEMKELETALDHDSPVSLEMIGYEKETYLTRYFYDPVTQTYWQHDTLSKNFYQIDERYLRQYLSRRLRLVTFLAGWENWLTQSI